MTTKGIGYHLVDDQVTYESITDPFTGKRSYWPPSFRPHPMDGILTPVTNDLREHVVPFPEETPAECPIFCASALEGKPSQAYAYIGPKPANRPGNNSGLIFANEVPNVELAYLLISPDRHYENIADATDAELKNLSNTLYNFLRAVQDNKDGYFDDVYDVAFSVNYGALSGGSVPHFHINLHFLRRSTDPDLVTKAVREKERTNGGRYSQFDFESNNGGLVVAKIGDDGTVLYTPYNATGDNQITTALAPGKNALSEMTEDDLTSLLKGLRLSARTVRELHGNIPFHMHGRIPLDTKDAGTSPIRIKQDPLYGNIGNPVCDASIGDKLSRSPLIAARDLREAVNAVTPTRSWVLAR